MEWTQVLSLFVTTTLVSYLLTPFIRLVAIRIDYLDHPKTTKVHAHPKPLMGGIAIFISFFIGIVSNKLIIESEFLIPIVTGALVLLAIGMVDDKMGMMPNMKLLGQFLAAMIVIKSGLRADFTGIYYIDVICTYLWIIGITNAFNLLDNMDGLSSGIAVIAGVFFGVISWISGQYVVSGFSFAIAGSCLGFLRHNFPKSSIFMGDSGSLVIGYVLSSIALLGTWETYIWPTSVMIPVLILGYPIFDTTLVIIMRTIEQRSIFNGGKDHSSHRLALLGLKRKRAVYVIYLICLLLGIAAIILAFMKPFTGVMVVAVSFIGMMVLGIRLGIVKTTREGRKKKVLSR